MKARLCWFVCGLLAAASAFAEEETFFHLSLEELMQVNVKSASLFPTTAAKAPGHVQVFDMDAIADTPVRTLGDLLSMHAAGSSVGNHQRQGAIHGVRGILIDNNAKTLVMLDGQQINQRSHFGYMTGLRSPLLGDLQAVEVINGPGAIQHGSGAINGFINLLPKTGASHPGAFARSEYGFAEDLWLAEGGVGIEYGADRNLYLYAGAFGAQGFEPNEDWEQPKRYPGQVDAFGHPTPNYRVSTSWNHEDFNLNAFFNEINSQKNNNEESGDWHTHSLGLRPRLTLRPRADDDFEIVASLILYDHSAVRPEALTNDERLGGREMHTELKATYRTRQMTRQALAVGALVGYKEFDAGRQYFGGDLVGPLESVDTHWTEFGAFAENVFDFTDDITLSAGLRYDLYWLSSVSGGNLGTESFTPEDPDGHLSPRLAFAWKATDDLHVKASYQHGFRMPDAAYYDWNLANNRAAEALGFAGSGGLKPEETDSFEVNVGLSVSEKVSVGINLFYNMFRDQLSWGPLQNAWSEAEVAAINAYNDVTWGGGMFQNIDQKFNVYGGELVGHWQVAPHTLLNASYGLAEIDDSDIVQRYPTHQVKLNSTSTFLSDKLIASLSYLFSSGFGPGDAPALAETYQNDRHMVDVSLTYRLMERASVKLVVQNVLAEDTPPPTFNMDRPSQGNMGADETRVYLSCRIAL